jgi:hypothetical protein
MNWGRKDRWPSIQVLERGYVPKSNRWKKQLALFNVHYNEPTFCLVWHITGQTLTLAGGRYWELCPGKSLSRLQDYRALDPNGHLGCRFGRANVI